MTIEYEGDRPVRVDTVVVSTQHAADIDLATLLQPDVEELVIAPILSQFEIDSEGHQVLVNPTGRFEVGGPMGDAGLTGRKIIIDTYGGMARHGGGAFSGKDPSKVDRSAAYAMRWVAKNVVAAGLASPMRGPGRLRHRQGAPRWVVRRDVRHRPGARRAHSRGRAVGLRSAAGRDHRRPRPAAADLLADRHVRSLRTRPARLHVGAHGSRRVPAGRQPECDLWVIASQGASQQSAPWSSSLLRPEFQPQSDLSRALSLICPFRTSIAPSTTSSRTSSTNKRSTGAASESGSLASSSMGSSWNGSRAPITKAVSPRCRG